MSTESRQKHKNQVFQIFFYDKGITWKCSAVICSLWCQNPAISPEEDPKFQSSCFMVDYPFGAEKRLGKMNILFKSLQYGSFIFLEQQLYFWNFIVSCCEKFSARGPLSATAMAAWIEARGFLERAIVVLSSNILLFLQGPDSYETVFLQLFCKANATQ